MIKLRAATFDCYRIGPTKGNIVNWKGLDRIESVESLSDNDREVLDELYSVLKRHGAERRFGLTLLHSHFDMDDDEILVERVDSEARTITISVEREGDFEPRQLIATSWRLDAGRADPILRCFRLGDHHAK